MRCRLLPKAHEGGALPLRVLGAHNVIEPLQALPASHSVGDAQADQHDELRGQHHPEATHAAERVLQGQAGRSQDEPYSMLECKGSISTAHHPHG